MSILVLGMSTWYTCSANLYSIVSYSIQ